MRESINILQNNIVLCDHLLSKTSPAFITYKFAAPWWQKNTSHPRFSVLLKGCPLKALLQHQTRFTASGSDCNSSVERHFYIGSRACANRHVDQLHFDRI